MARKTARLSGFTFALFYGRVSFRDHGLGFRVYGFGWYSRVYVPVLVGLLYDAGVLFWCEIMVGYPDTGLTPSSFQF